MSEEVLGRYRLKVRWIDVYANHVVTINGFPARERWVKAHTVRNEFDVPLETGLVDGKNKVEVRLRPRLRRYGEKLEVEEVNFEARLMPFRGAAEATEVLTQAEVDSAYRAWVGRAEEKWTEYRSRVEEGALDSMRAWAARNPMVVSTRFDNEHGPDFSRVFEEAPVLKDTPATRKRLKDYAMGLRDWMAEKDTSALVEAFGPRMKSAFKMSGATSREQFRKQYTSGLVYKDAEESLAFGREVVEMRPWCGGRVWELFRKPGKPLLRRMEVYVAEIGGELKVVR